MTCSHTWRRRSPFLATRAGRRDRRSRPGKLRRLDAGVHTATRLEARHDFSAVPHPSFVKPVAWTITPVYARVGRQLIEGLKNKSVVTDQAARSVFAMRPVGLRDAVSRAIRYEDRAFALTRWSDARSSGGELPSQTDARFGSKLIDARQIHVPVDADRAFVPIATIGGAHGWY